MKPSIHNYSGLRPVHGKARALFAASSLGILLALPAGAATVIPVTNHSFETPTLGDGGGAGFTGWSFFGVNGGAITYNPTSANFTGAAGSGTPSGADGANVLSTNAAQTTGYGGVNQVITGAQLTAGETYTMTVAVGAYKDLGVSDWRLAINTQSMAIGNYLAATTGTAGQLTVDDFNDFTVQYTATGSETQKGENLQIWIMNAANSWSSKNVAFDNVRFTSIPEPSAALLGGIGCLLLLRRRSR